MTKIFESNEEDKSTLKVIPQQFQKLNVKVLSTCEKKIQ